MIINDVYAIYAIYMPYMHVLEKLVGLVGPLRSTRPLGTRALALVRPQIRPIFLVPTPLDQGQQDLKSVLDQRRWENSSPSQKFLA